MYTPLFQSRLGSNALPEVVPLFELEGALLLPRAHLPVHIHETRYKTLVDNVLGNNRFVGFVQPRSSPSEDRPDVFETGCLGQISTFVDSGNGNYFVVIRGVIRFHINSLIDDLGGYRKAQVTYDRYLLDLTERSEPIEEREQLVDLLKDFLKYGDGVSNWHEIAESSDENLISLLAMVCPFAPQEKQAILETHSLTDRSRIIATLMEMAALKGHSKLGRAH